MKELDIKEFYEKGYLQELNRLFLHPLGLVLTIKLNKNTGKLELDKILDYRDREVKFSKEGLDRQRYENIKKELLEGGADKELVENYIKNLREWGVFSDWLKLTVGLVLIFIFVFWLIP